jgi:hypothetical protein
MRHLSHLGRSDFLLSVDEAEEFLDFPLTGLGLRPTKDFLHWSLFSLTNVVVLLGQCVCLSIVYYRFRKDESPLEHDVLQYTLSWNFTANMERCFGIGHSKSSGKDLTDILKLMFMKKMVEPRLPTQSNNRIIFADLEKSGILVRVPNGDTCEFSSLMARRHYFGWLFPDRTLT